MSDIELLYSLILVQLKLISLLILLKILEKNKKNCKIAYTFQYLEMIAICCHLEIFWIF